MVDWQFGKENRQIKFHVMILIISTIVIASKATNIT